MQTKQSVRYTYSFIHKSFCFVPAVSRVIRLILREKRQKHDNNDNNNNNKILLKKGKNARE